MISIARWKYIAISRITRRGEDRLDARLSAFLSPSFSLSLSLLLSHRAKFSLREATSFPARRKRHEVFPIDRPELIDFLRSFPPVELFLFLFSPPIIPFESYRDRESFPHRYLRTRIDSYRDFVRRSSFRKSTHIPGPKRREKEKEREKEKKDPRRRRKSPFCGFVRVASRLSSLGAVPCAPLCSCSISFRCFAALENGFSEEFLETADSEIRGGARKISQNRAEWYTSHFNTPKHRENATDAITDS